MKSVQIYKVTSPSGNIYIGVSKNPKHRWVQHVSDKESALYPVVQKYGKDNLTWEIIYSSFSEDDAYEKEIYFIKKYDSYKNGYNRTKGGDKASKNGKLTEKEVFEVIKLLKDERLTHEEIGNIFNVKAGTIRNISSGKTWSSITGIIKPLKREKVSARGERQGTSKLTEDQVIKIKTSYMKGVKISDLSKEFSVDIKSINNILSERNWKHVKVEGFIYKPRLSKEKVIRLWRDKLNNMKVKDILKKYIISKTTYYNIIKGKVWKDVYEEFN